MDDDNCVELVEVESVDHESSHGSANNELNKHDGVRQRFLPLEGSRSKVSNTSDSQHVMESTVNPEHTV